MGKLLPTTLGWINVYWDLCGGRCSTNLGSWWFHKNGVTIQNRLGTTWIHLWMQGVDGWMDGIIYQFIWQLNVKIGGWMPRCMYVYINEGLNIYINSLFWSECRGEGVDDVAQINSGLMDHNRGTNSSVPLGWVCFLTDICWKSPGCISADL